MTRRWGPWRFFEETLELVHAESRYRIDIERLNSSPRMLDAIFQIGGKLWADPATMHGLIQALDDLIFPQGSICSGGGEGGPIEVAKLIRRTR